VKFTIAPDTPIKDLLPAPPKAALVPGPLLTDDLAVVPEIDFQARPEKLTPDKHLEAIAHQLAKINHLNAKQTDAFMAALLENRDDLRGLPFVMGDECRTAGERSKQFRLAATAVRQALGNRRADRFWHEFGIATATQDTNRDRQDQAPAEHATLARVAVLTQILGVESAELQLGVVNCLSAIPHVDATRKLARMAIFSADQDVRLAAVGALRTRLPHEYAKVLANGLRYPWPAVARRSADAIVRLRGTGLIPDLLAALEAPDPRLPVTEEVGGKKVSVVREMVKLNHHRNCMMCHAPAGTEKLPDSVLTAPVPVLGVQLPSSVLYYRESSPREVSVRADVTYLRQDFSLMMAVPNAEPWPQMQRFDFLVRERVVTDEEATTYRKKLAPKGFALSPYHEAVLAALRDLTGRDVGRTAEAWRKELKIPSPDRR
jgi:hypothetical protein